MGFVVCAQHIEQVLLDYDENGSFQGGPSLMIDTISLENEAQKEYLVRDADSEVGIRVQRVSNLSNAFGVLRPNDVLLTIDGSDIGEDETVVLRHQERVHYSFTHAFKRVGDSVNLTFSRNWSTLHADVELQRELFNIKTQYCVDHWNNYYLFGGMVFGSLNYEAITQLEQGVNRFKDSWDHADVEKDEIVVLQILNNKVNFGYKDLISRKILGINGE